MEGMRCQHNGCGRTATVNLHAEATLQIRLTLPVSLTASAYSCPRHVGPVAKDLARRVTEGVGGVSAGIVSLAYSFRPVKGIEGWNVYGYDENERLVFNCLHLHQDRSLALSCAIECDEEAVRERDAGVEDDL